LRTTRPGKWTVSISSRGSIIGASLTVSLTASRFRSGRGWAASVRLDAAIGCAILHLWLSQARHKVYQENRDV
jgi:hypothetical protein